MTRSSVAKSAESHVRARFGSLGDETRAAAQKAYMKSVLRFHGVTSADVRDAARELLRDDPDLDHDGLVALADALFSSEWFDVRSVGGVLLERKRKLLGPDDLPWLLELVRRCRCWAHVDALATNVVGAIVGANPTTLRKLPAWARDDDLWVRRTALLSQERALARGAGDFELFARIATPMLPEKEFFIRKAIGWVLRSTSKKRPEQVFEFLKEHRDAVSGLTLREGAKYLPEKMRRSLGLVSGSPPRT